ncbi:MAG: DUF4382 domain-containing protein [Armatimonadetes bacterium]|nr:DUF4382 domain-containing protein [Armatimonadota bacterium]MDE2206595.1 DUF4382 domain-containing protein [Armatimonadota bacterium]
MKTRTALALLVLAAIGLAGCGGGGGTGSSGGPGATRSAAINTWMTDTPGSPYTHVWVTLYHVELATAHGAPLSAWSDPSGVVVDLASLHDSHGPLFAFLGSGSVTPGIYTMARVVLGADATVFTSASPSGQVVPISGQSAGSGQVAVSFNLKSPRTESSGSDDIAIDFNLAGFMITGGKLATAMSEGDESGISDESRQTPREWDGSVSGLSGTAPNLSFSLQAASGEVIQVDVNQGTVVYNSDASPSPVLANGELVEVFGIRNTSLHAVEATAVQIDVAGSGDSDTAVAVRGAPTNVLPSAGSFQVTVGSCRHLLPQLSTVNVLVTANTVLRDDGGVIETPAAFFSILGGSLGVKVVGSYDSSSNTITAFLCRIDQSHEAGEVELSGPVSTIDLAQASFTVQTRTQWDGFINPGGSLLVQTVAGTAYRLKGQPITMAAFFAQLKAGESVRVHGTLSGTSVTAATVDIGSD